ncbi:MAG TPA: zinc-binding alcohol dehydrogenase family protein, partial [Puia sp.]|nr:zinc-binding alcohol dehydrogenase family protein [Puia sp.]
QFGEIPKCADFPDPVAAAGEQIIHVKAAVLENFDKMTAKGIQYASKKMIPVFPAVVGLGGIGTTENGHLVGFRGARPPYGSMAEKTVVRQALPIPEGIDPVQASALPAAVLTSYLPLRFTANLRPGETVLINGATGVSGKIAVQIARMMGAKRVVGTGRNERSLNLLRGLGADAVVDLKQPDEKIMSDIKKESADGGIDVIIDFIWGHPAELIMQSFVPEELGLPEKRIRYIHVGQKAGSNISLSGEMLRTSGLEIYGAANIPRERIPEAMKQVWQWIREDKFQIEIERIPLADIESAWMRDDLDGKRIVIIP